MAGASGYQGASSGQSSSNKKRGGKGGNTHNQTAPNVFSGLYRVFFKMDEANGSES